jgi:thiamine biosynthesis lipoprotein
MERHAFRSMGTDIEALLDVEPGPSAALGLSLVEEEFGRLEAILTRFDEGSELSRLNAEGSIDPGPDLRAVVELALEARERTNGRFDPTIYDALVAAGYDRTFESLRAAPTATLDPCPTGGRVHVGPALIVLEPGVRLDLGGIGKGYAVDRAVSLLAPYGPCLVNAGGDLAVRGVPQHGTWAVAVDGAGFELTLGLTSGALATSGRDRRTWSTASGTAHHLIDPKTGLPSDSDLLRVTIVAATAVNAEVLAKALYLAGEELASAEAEAHGVPGILVTADGRTRLVGGLA